MVFGSVRTIAFDTPCSLNSARQGSVTPLPTILAQWYTRVHVSAPDGSNEVSYIETSVNEHFGILTALDVPNIYPD